MRFLTPNLTLSGDSNTLVLNGGVSTSLVTIAQGTTETLSGTRSVTYTGTVDGANING